MKMLVHTYQNLGIYLLNNLGDIQEIRESLFQNSVDLIIMVKKMTNGKAIRRLVVSEKNHGINPAENIITQSTAEKSALEHDVIVVGVISDIHATLPTKKQTLEGKNLLESINKKLVELGVEPLMENKMGVSLYQGAYEHNAKRGRPKIEKPETNWMMQVA
jgi:hypothetical protein